MILSSKGLIKKHLKQDLYKYSVQLRRMVEQRRKNNVTKVYCLQCDSVFENREKFEKHFEKHSGVSCESCPLDVAVQKFTNLFKRTK